jgi:hypothetical protein
MRRIFLLVFLIFGACLQKPAAQGVPDMPQILPPSPEPANMARANNMDISLSSGMANVSIPLHELKLGKYSLPITLNYSSNGLKMDEIPSRAGMGWTLNAGGVVTRVVHGKPDEKSIRMGPPTGTAPLEDWVNYYNQLSNTASGTYDNEPDVYMISAPGLSGKFIIDNNGQVIKIPYSNYKINVISTASPYTLKVNITDPNGVVYYFGYDDKVEKTVTHNLQGKYVVHQSVITAMFLTRIVYPDGRFITFSYASPITYTTYIGVSQSLTGEYYQPYQGPPCLCTGSMPPYQCNYSPGILQTSATEIQYNSPYLNGIQTSDNRNIIISYQARPDNGGDKRFTSLMIVDGAFSRTYTFNYEDPAQGIAHPNGTVNKRFFLKELYWLLPITDNTFDTIRYSFNYYDNLNGLPPRLGNGQDHLGYYNGANNPYLLPYSLPNDSVNWNTSYAVADRNPNANAAKAGTLVRVTYPTGGYQEFEYEGNIHSKYQQLNSNSASRTTGGSGNTNGGGQYIPQYFYSQLFNIQQNQTCNLSLYVYANPGCSGSCNPPDPGTTDLAKIQVVNKTSNTVVWENTVRQWGFTTYNIPVTAIANYRLELTVWGLPNAASAEIRYDPESGPVWGWVNYNAPGLRVKKITSFDPVSSKSTNRHFTYKTTPSDVQSSASYLLQPDYISLSHTKILCQTDLTQYVLDACRNSYSPPIPIYQTVRCKAISLVSNTSMANYSFDDNHLLYNTVLEADDLSMANGYTQHKFWVYPITNSTIQLGYKHQSIPASTTTQLYGYEKETNYFNKTGSLVKKSLNYYTTLNAESPGTVSALAVRKRYNQIETNNDPENMLDPYDVTQYDFVSHRINLDSTVIIDYDNSSRFVKNKTTYFYGSYSNLSPIKTEATTSADQLLITEMKYPTDYPNTEPYTTMINKNIINPVIETKQKRGTEDLSLVRSNYAEWYNTANALVIEPQTIVAKKGSASEETRIRFHKYDNCGNPLEVSTENGVRISYIWDDNKNFPLVEIKNAGLSIDSIAATSFENDSKGYWEFTGTPVMETFQPTGYYCYNLSTGNISRPVNSSVSYYVTYWLKDASGSVSVNGTPSETLLNKNGWTCFRHLVSGSTMVFVIGTGKIDELRLYPISAFVTSFTYRPFVGISTRCEPNNAISYYDYDGGLRLKLIRDMDWKIIKQYDYAYKQQITPCPNSNANWVATGLLRCVKTADHTNNNTGVQEKEERDMNNCSATYLQLRWVSLGINGQCPPVANCSGPDKRVVNGVCETGLKTLVSSYQTGPNSWTCTYKYVWSDGFAGPEFVEYTTLGCAI